MDFDPIKLFSFSGRVNRSTFWIINIASLVAFFALYFLMGIIFASNIEVADGLVLLAVGVYFWISLATQVKRWHDRNKSGWWVLSGMIPIVSVWAIIETGFLAGTRGANAYGAPSSGAPFHQPPAITTETYRPFYADDNLDF